MELPVVLFSSSCSSFRPQEFVKSILKVSELPRPKVVSDNIERYEWSFETKYYSTTVNICTADTRIIGDKDLAESVQAFINFFDPNIPSSFDLVKAWLPYLSHIKPDICILVCNTSQNSDAIPRKVILEWCVQNAFELVELSPAEESDNEEEDFPVTIGLARIVQALHAHPWTNMKMKNSVNVYSSCLRHMVQEQDMLKNQHQIVKAPMPSKLSCGIDQHLCTSPTLVEHFNSDGHMKKLEQDIKASNLSNSKNTDVSTFKGVEEVDIDKLYKMPLASDQKSILQLDSTKEQTLLTDTKDKAVPVSDRRVDEDDFEQLFMKLKIMKDEAENLPFEQRKQFAEKVAVSFWKAIGGDNDEIDGLDEDSD